jgi:hypothetical protein
MATSTGKTIGLILLIALIAIIALRMTPLIMAPWGSLTGIFSSVRLPHIKTMNFWPFKCFNLSSFSILSLALLVFWIFITIWVYKDAEKRNMNGVLWALLVFIGNIIGLIIYLILRSENGMKREERASVLCPGCQKPVDSNFTYCPECGMRIHPVCEKCNTQVEKGWKVCPNCGEKLTFKNG